MLKFRGLNADEIDVRVAQVGNGWAQLLLYKDARVDMTILDETVGPENWTRDHYECKGNLFCKVGIKCNNEWIWKSDCGAESNTEKEKGEASDSFKRACVNWGIGRELYTKIPIFVNVETVQNGNYNKLKNKEFWTVKEIEIDKEKNKINYLEIADRKSNIVFTYGNKTNIKNPENFAENSIKIKEEDGKIVEVKETGSLKFKRVRRES